MGKESADINHIFAFDCLLDNARKPKAAGIDIQKAINEWTPTLVAGVYDTRAPGPIARKEAIVASGTKISIFTSARLLPFTPLGSFWT
ncbi:MAG: hypothetical protein ACW979_06930 [Candidatus Thorarchaeota archaeon]|jgi:hypothetical protein